MVRVDRVVVGLEVGVPAAGDGEAGVCCCRRAAVVAAMRFATAYFAYFAYSVYFAYFMGHGIALNADKLTASAAM
ncbi:MAG: hypothetical protein AAF480_19490, partial [Actinomycetota bacterium]